MEELEEVKASIKLKKLKNTLITAAAIAAIVLIGVAVICIQNAKINELKEEVNRYTENPSLVNPVSPEISLDVVNEEIRGMGELATMEYFYTNAAKFSDAKHIKAWTVPFTKKSFIMKWDGVIKAGIEVDEITTEIDTEKKVLTVYLPQAKILSHDPDKESAEVLDEKDGLFNPVTVDDQVKFDAAVEKEMEEQTIERGLLEKAQKNAEEIIEKLLLAVPGAEEYTIEFKTLEQ